MKRWADLCRSVLCPLMLMALVVSTLSLAVICVAQAINVIRSAMP